MTDKNYNIMKTYHDLTVPNSNFQRKNKSSCVLVLAPLFQNNLR